MDLTARRQSPVAQAGGDYEVFDYPGEFADAGQGDAAVKVMLEQQQMHREVSDAAGNVRPLTVGDLFTLASFPRDDQNKEYLVVQASYAIELDDYESTGDPSDDRIFRSQVSLIDGSQQFRSDRSTIKPTVEGPQTAVVVGASGEEIFTDEYGRVKVKFHWDRESQGDENSSCWVRVSQLWAGASFGGIHVPRIGQEVIVDFLEGDPDRPIITGRVYNFDNMPPYELPANRTQSGIKSQSSKGATLSNFNELRFEDKKGEEHVYVQAEKDLVTLVKNEEARDVGASRTTSIGTDEALTVGQNRDMTIGADESLGVGSSQTVSIGSTQTITVVAARSVTSGTETISTGTRTKSVGTNESTSIGGSRSEDVGRSETISVGKDQIVNVGGKRSHSVEKDDSLTVGGKRTQSVDKDDQLMVGKKLVIDAGEQMTLKSGKASIVLKKNGDIVIKGKNVKIEGSGKINVKASSDVVIKGSKVKSN